MSTIVSMKLNLQEALLFFLFSFQEKRSWSASIAVWTLWGICTKTMRVSVPGILKRWCRHQRQPTRSYAGKVRRRWIGERIWSDSCLTKARWMPGGISESDFKPPKRHGSKIESVIEWSKWQVNGGWSAMYRYHQQTQTFTQETDLVQSDRCESPMNYSNLTDCYQWLYARKIINSNCCSWVLLWNISWKKRSSNSLMPLFWLIIIIDKFSPVALGKASMLKKNFQSYLLYHNNNRFLRKTISLILIRELNLIWRNDPRKKIPKTGKFGRKRKSPTRFSRRVTSRDRTKLAIGKVGEKAIYLFGIPPEIISSPESILVFVSFHEVRVLRSFTGI